jgi:hypothetical protein
VSNAAAFGIGIAIGFLASVVLSLWVIQGGFTRARGRTRALVMLALVCVVPIVAAAFMPTFPAALLVILGNGIGFALSHVVTLPMRYFAEKRNLPRT